MMHSAIMTYFSAAIGAFAAFVAGYSYAVWDVKGGALFPTLACGGIAFIALLRVARRAAEFESR